MEQITSKIFADASRLSRQQAERVNVGLAAAHAVWAAAQAHPSWASPHLRPHGRCIYAALLVTEVLHGLGWTQAAPLKCGLDIIGVMHHQKRQLTIGAPDTPQIDGLLNAHLVVQLDDVIIDPTLEQARRPWNDLPHIGAFVANAVDGQSIDILPGCKMPVIAHGSLVALGSGFQLSYFKLPRAVARSTRKWTASPDARPCRRREIAEAALAIARGSLMPSEAMAA